MKVMNLYRQENVIKINKYVIQYKREKLQKYYSSTCTCIIICEKKITLLYTVEAYTFVGLKFLCYCVSTLYLSIT